MVVLAKAGKDSKRANKVLSEEFGPIIGAFDGDGSIIHDITRHMNDEEKELYLKYRVQYGNK